MWIVCLAACFVSPANSELLWFNQSAGEWSGALPVGNGRLGAMMFGRVDDETIQLNEDSIWTKSYHGNSTINPASRNVSSCLKHVRAALSDYRYGDAEEASECLMGKPEKLSPYQPLGNLSLSFNGRSREFDSTSYRRELDLDSGVARVHYSTADGKTSFTREIFAPAASNVIVMTIDAKGPDKIGVTIQLNRSQDARGDVKVVTNGQQQLDLTGSLKHTDPTASDYLLFQGSVRVISDGEVTGSTSSTPSISVNGAQHVTLIISAGSNFDRPEGQSSAAAVDTRVVALLDNAVTKGHAALLSEQTNAFRSIALRVNLSLGTTAAEIAALPTNERVRRARLQVLGKVNGTRTADEDPGLFTLLFQFGRYLLAFSIHHTPLIHCVLGTF
jgi:alpha-L-fucosidase 2